MPAKTAASIRIDYRRLPDRDTVFDQLLVEDAGAVIVTLAPRCSITRPMIIDDTIVLEPDSPVVWFSFPGAWHDIGRFHRADGSFTGLYANIITPIELETRQHWRTVDLFLDLWLDWTGRLRVLDEDELSAAAAAGDISPELVEAARAEADRLQSQWLRGEWPPPIVSEWTLQRARETCAA
jgi:uncharacterized protein